MKLFYLRPYRTGYLGFLEDRDAYAYFQFPRRGELRVLIRYPKKDYHGYRHFISGLNRFIPCLFFFKAPVPLEPVSIQVLDRIYQEWSEE